MIERLVTQSFLSTNLRLERNGLGPESNHHRRDCSTNQQLLRRNLLKYKRPVSYPLGIMLKRLTILSLLLASCGSPLPVPGQPADRGSPPALNLKNETGKSKTPAEPVITVIKKNCGSETFKDDSDCKAAEQKLTPIEITKLPSANISIDRGPERDRFDWIAYIGNILLVAVGIGTLIAVWIQARRMKEHADELKNVAAAALLNAKALIESERAWLTVTMGVVRLEPEPADPNIQVTFWMNPTVANHGRTPARLTRMYLRYRLCKSITELPFVPVYEVEDDDPSDDGSSYFDGQLLIVPNSGISPLSASIDNEAAKAVRAGDMVLVLYGYVKYEINGVPEETTRFTRFIFRYDIADKGSPIPEGFHFPTGLPEYNRAT